MYSLIARTFELADFHMHARTVKHCTNSKHILECVNVYRTTIKLYSLKLKHWTVGKCGRLHVIVEQD